MVDPQVCFVECVRLHGCPRLSSDYFRPYIEIYTVRDSTLRYTTCFGNLKKFKVENEKKGPFDIDLSKSPAVVGDIMLKVYHSGNKKIQTSNI